MPAPVSNTANRRGMLLLLVLSMLTLFLMAGALMMVLATRARTTARAFSTAANTNSSGGIQSRRLLDEALMVLLRGSKGTLPPQMTESILEDRYGTPIVGETTAGSVALLSKGTFNNYAPILTGTVQNLIPAVSHPCDLNGRILTFKPDPDDGEPASYRILRTTGTTAPYTVFMANMATSRAVVLPKKRCDIILNGREFCPIAANSGTAATFSQLPSLTPPTSTVGTIIKTNDNGLFWILASNTTWQLLTRNEHHDSYQTDPAGSRFDPWLTQPQLLASQVNGVTWPAYQSNTAQPLECDNDNDAVADGIWITGTTGFLPDRPSPLGGSLKYQISYLVLDLDGRVNVNAHGTLIPVTSGSADWPATVAGVEIASVPVGLGYGPADVDASRLVATGTNTNGAPGFSGRWSNLVLAGTSTPTQLTSGSNQRRATPLVGTAVDGRYGSDASGQRVPGAVGATVAPLQQSALVGAFPPPSGRPPTDLNVRMKMFSQPPSAGGVPTLTFYTPDRTADDFLQDPYELRLDSDGSRNATLTRSGTAMPADNPFTAAELERILRQFDSDTNSLSPRLATLLDDYAERSRMTITTDSWDTPAMGGIAMQKLQAAMRLFPPPTEPLAVVASGNASAVYDTLSPDVTAGLRFDINRPLQHSAVPAGLVVKLKQRFCQHLYTLLVALGQPANEQTAQWAVNVCDFRDPDSTMTRFQYDTNIYDGWSSGDAASVFGAERPEVVITETLAWNGYLAVVLYHPWAAWMVDKQTATNLSAGTPVEGVDPNLADTVNSAALDLSRKTSTGDSIWRLRVVGGSSFPFGQVAVADIAKCKLMPNGYVCVQTSSDIATTLNTLTDSTFKPIAPGNGSVVLERLADPTKAMIDDQTNADYNPYVAVDEALLNVYADKLTALSVPKPKNQRNDATFWKQAWISGTATLGTYPSQASWYHWPNRPFVSVAELALVPKGNASQILQNFKIPSSSVGFDSLATDPTIGLLDAVHVPSRFAGTGKRIGMDSLLQSMATAERIGTTVIPLWREPGRVNVNTIASNSGNTSQPLLNDGVWKAVSGNSAPATNPFDPSVGTADTFTKLLSLSTDPNKPPYVATSVAPLTFNPFFSYATTIRMANVATIRSHVFAVWITLKTIDTSAAGPSETYHRLFAIIDRSIPVGFSKGEDLNVRDTIRVLRFLE
jgi:hypothetical protein